MRNLARLLMAAAVSFLMLTCCSAPPQTSGEPPAPADSEAQTVLPQPEQPPEKAEMPEVSLDELLPPYEFGRPLAAGDPTEDAAFENCAFIGDSRTEGL